MFLACDLIDFSKTHNVDLPLNSNQSNCHVDLDLYHT